MNSLRWRIAVWYALLLIAVVAALGLAIALRFEQILRDQDLQRAQATVADIERSAAPSPNSFAFSEGGDALRVLENPDNLERWSSTTTYIEVDDPHGYMLAKSFNMGAMPGFGNSGVTATRRTTTRDISIGGTPFLVYSALLATGSHAVVVQVAEPLDQLFRTFRQVQLSMLVILTIGAIAMIVLSYALASQATNPINELAKAMHEIGSEGLHRRLRWNGRRDEIGNLAQSFDDLLARLEEAFARERQFISDASHELKTPLTSINANAQMLARWGDRDDTVRKESLQTIIDESTSLANMVSGMLTLAKADSGDAIPKEPLSLASIAKEACNGAAGRANDKGLRLDLQTPKESPIVEGDPTLLRQMITNLIDNAIKFTERGSVTVRVREQDDRAIVEVEDTGPGIDPAEVPNIFNRFYRTDRSRSRAVPGTGLGLAIVRSIVRIHGGSVEATRPPGGGTLFRIVLPQIH
ncbi:MAG TPA: HAMP domain-containing sensor histidine kinase [Candidatus Baltobacteraceae bacterium]|jgi:heavy metal sensor kinase|nr:HAMP domain-containing sensor histidine kinase [Candidatus Baltobacteraceae bacterium]